MEKVAKQEIEGQTMAIKSNGNKIDAKNKPIRIATTSQNSENDDSQQLVHIAPNQIQIAHAGQLQTLEGVQGN